MLTDTVVVGFFTQTLRPDISITSLRVTAYSLLTFWRRNYFFLILAHSVYKM